MGSVLLLELSSGQLPILRYAQAIFSISLADTYFMSPVLQNGKNSQVFFTPCGSTRPCPQNGGSGLYCSDLFMCKHPRQPPAPCVTWFIAHCDTYGSVNIICIFNSFFLFLIPKLNKNHILSPYFLYILCPQWQSVLNKLSMKANVWPVYR